MNLYKFNFEFKTGSRRWDKITCIISAPTMWEAMGDAEREARARYAELFGKEPGDIILVEIVIPIPLG